MRTAWLVFPLQDVVFNTQESNVPHDVLHGIWCEEFLKDQLIITVFQVWLTYIVPQVFVASFSVESIFSLCYTFLVSQSIGKYLQWLSKTNLPSVIPSSIVLSNHLNSVAEALCAYSLLCFFSCHFFLAVVSCSQFSSTQNA